MCPARCVVEVGVGRAVSGVAQLLDDLGSRCRGGPNQVLAAVAEQHRDADVSDRDERPGGQRLAVKRPGRASGLSAVRAQNQNGPGEAPPMTSTRCGS